MEDGFDQNTLCTCMKFSNNEKKTKVERHKRRYLVSMSGLYTHMHTHSMPPHTPSLTQRPQATDRAAVHLFLRTVFLCLENTRREGEKQILPKQCAQPQLSCSQGPGLQASAIGLSYYQHFPVDKIISYPYFLHVKQ